MWFVEELLGHTLPRVGLLLSGIALLGAALHWMVGSAMPSYLVHCFLNWCSASHVEPGRAFLRMCDCVRCCRLGCVGRKSPQSCLLWEAVHPIRRHYTPSDRVHRDVTGALRRNGCSAAWPVRVERGHGKWSITKSVMKLVTDEGYTRSGRFDPF